MRALMDEIVRVDNAGYGSLHHDELEPGRCIYCNSELRYIPSRTDGCRYEYPHTDDCPITRARNCLED